jgi:serine O-acetyltransferase
MVIQLYRLSNWLWRHRVPVVPRAISLASRIVFSTVLPPSAELGRGVTLAYSGLGTIIHARAKIGAGTHVGAKVTVGGRAGLHGVPVIGANVLIGAGAQIIGPVTIGDGAKIGANAVVVNDVQPGTTVVGIPAIVVARSPSLVHAMPGEQ